MSKFAERTIMPEESPELSEIRANENIMSQRLYGVVATMASLLAPMLDTMMIDDEDDGKRSQAFEELNKFVSLHLETEELKNSIWS